MALRLGALNGKMACTKEEFIYDETESSITVEICMGIEMHTVAIERKGSVSFGGSRCWGVDWPPSALTKLLGSGVDA
jgi:hypothetical protein